MATLRASNNTTLSSSIHERRHVQARIRALQQRTNALHEELSRSSSVAKSTGFEIEQAYSSLTNEFRDQRDQLLRRLHRMKENIKQSNNELNSIRKNLNTAQSFQIPQNSPRYSADYGIDEMNAMMNDIERVLHNIAQQLKQVRFIPSNGPAVSRTLGTIHVKDNHHKEKELILPESYVDEYHSSANLFVRKLYTIDLDISAHWVIASIDKRIFLCDHEGETRIFSYSEQLRRQPLLIERFHLSTIRLISCLTVTQDYLIAFESDTEILTLHTHHGALLLRLHFLYDPTMIVRCDYKRKNQIWTCNRNKRQCYQFHLNHTTKQIDLLDQLDFSNPISNVLVDPIGVSTDEQGRIAVHDVNPAAMDRLLLFANHQNAIHLLDFIRYDEKTFSSRIERVLLVPKQPHLIILLHAPHPSTSNLHEIVVADIHLQPPEILHRLSEPNGVQNIDVTLNSELVYTVTTPANKRIPPKMHIYSLIN